MAVEIGGSKKGPRVAFHGITSVFQVLQLSYDLIISYIHVFLLEAWLLQHDGDGMRRFWRWLQRRRKISLCSVAFVRTRLTVVSYWMVQV